MSRRWRQRPAGSNWGDFGDDDQLGRLNLLTPERVAQAAREVQCGRRFCLSLPLDYPGKSVLNPLRKPPKLMPLKEKDAYPIVSDNAHHTDLIFDEAVLLYSQYSTQWDSLAHIGSMFDADQDGVGEYVLYNGYRPRPLDPDDHDAHIGAPFLGIETMAAFGIQGRGVMIDLRQHFGEARRVVGYADLMRIMDQEGIKVESGDMVCLHTGIDDLLLRMQGDPDGSIIRTSCAVLDGQDARLLQWITDSGLVALIADNQAVEGSSIWTFLEKENVIQKKPALPLHEHCIFKLGIPLGELWYLSELAQWLRSNGRYRFFLTAPPLRLPGAVGSPVTPLATV